MIGKASKVYPQIQGNLHLLLKGNVIVIDPSIGSSSSQPGWAHYRASQLMDSGTLSINPEWSVPERLQELRRQMYNLYKMLDPDILVYEDIPPMRQGGGNAAAHASLLKAVGAILSIAGPRAFVGILPVSWKALARDTYVKSDENDAIEIGWVVLTEADRIQEQDPPRKRHK